MKVIVINPFHMDPNFSRRLARVSQPESILKRLKIQLFLWIFCILSWLENRFEGELYLVKVPRVGEVEVRANSSAEAKRKVLKQENIFTNNKTKPWQLRARRKPLQGGKHDANQ